jgi:hypothetical protein
MCFRHPEYAAPKLSGRYASFDPASETRKLLKEAIWGLESHNAVALAKYDDLRIILVSGQAPKDIRIFPIPVSISIATPIPIKIVDTRLWPGA